MHPFQVIFCDRGLGRRFLYCAFVEKCTHMKVYGGSGLTAVQRCSNWTMECLYRHPTHIDKNSRSVSVHAEIHTVH